MATIKNAIDPQLQADLPRLDIVPTSSPTPLTISVVERNNGTRDITVTWSYTQSRIEATHIGLLWNVNPSSAPPAPTVSNNSGSVILPISQTSYTFEGVHPEQYYRLGIVAGKQVESSWSTTAVVSPTTSPNWQVSKGTSNNTNNINGVLASAITAAMVNFNSSNDQNGNAISAPTGLVLTQTLNSVGSVDLTLSWNWTGNEFDIDGFGIYVHADSASTPYTLGNPSDTVYPTLPSLRSLTAFGVAQNQYYTIGVRAYRVVDTNVNASGFILSSITQLAAIRPSATPNITANVGGQTSTAIANTVTGLSDLNNNGKLTPNEKQDLLRKFNEILQYKPGLISQATSFSITTELSTYTAKFQALADFLNNGSTWTSGDPFLLNSTNILVTSDVTGITLDTKILEYINAFEALNQKLNLVSSTKATWENVDSIPYSAIYSTDEATQFNLNPAFASWSGAYPDGYVQWTGEAPTKETTIRNNNRFSARWTTDGTQKGMQRTITFAPLPAKFLLSGSVDFYLVSRVSGLPAFLIIFYENANFTGTQVNALAYPNPITGVWQKVPFTVQGHATLTMQSAVVYFLASWVGGQGVFNGDVIFGGFRFTIQDGSFVNNKLQQFDDVGGATKPENNATKGAPAGSLINGVLAETVQTYAADARNGTIKYRTNGAPTNSPSPTSATVTDNTVGGRNIQLNWGTYTQGTNQADFLLLFYKEGSGTPTINDACIQFNVNTSASYHIFTNVDMTKTYSAGIAAARRTENGIEIGTIVTHASWTIAAGTLVNSATALDSIPATTFYKNSSANLIVDDGFYSSSYWGFGFVWPAWATPRTNVNEIPNISRYLKLTAIGAINAEGIVFPINQGKDYRYKLSIFLSSDFTGWISPAMHIPNVVWLIPAGAVADPNGAYSGVLGFTQASLPLNQVNVLEVSVNAANTFSSYSQTWIRGRVTTGYALIYMEFIPATNTNDLASDTKTKLLNGDTAATDTTTFRTVGAPTNQPTIGTITASTVTSNGLVDLTLEWSYTQGALPAEEFVIHYLPGTTNPTISDPVIATVPGTARKAVITGVPVENSYRAGIVARRLSKNGIEAGAIVNAWARTGSAVNITSIINNVTAATLTVNAANGNTAATETVNFRNTGAPTNNPVVSTNSVSSISKGGTVDVIINWTYTQGVLSADEFWIYANQGTGTITTASPLVAKVGKDARSYPFIGVPADKDYRAGIVAVRNTANGPVPGTLITGFSYAAQTVTLNSDQLGGTNLTTINNNIAVAATTATWAGTSNVPGAIYNTNDAAALNLNPSFSDWSGSYPDGYVAWNGAAPIKETTLVRVGKFSARWNNMTQASSVGMVESITFAPLPVNFILSGTVDIYMVSRTAGLPVFYMLLAENENGTGASIVSWVVPASTDIGKWHRVPFTVRGNGTNQMRFAGIYFLASWSGNGGFAGSVVFDNFQFNIQDSLVFDNKAQQFNDVLNTPNNVKTLTGTELIRNSDITINSNGQLVNIGTANTVVDNTKIAVNDAGLLTGIAASASVGNNIDRLIKNPGGGMFTTLTSTFTGALRITLPVFFTDTMLKFVVDIYEFSTGLSCLLSISGFNGSSGNAWVGVTANVIGGNTEYPVYFGHNGTKAVVWIGGTTESWVYPQVQIRDVAVSYFNYSKSMWESGWVIDFSSAARTNVTATVLDTLPGADLSKSSKQISTTQIVNAAVTAAKTAIAAIDPNSGNLTANSVTANAIAAGAVTAIKIAANTITANEIASNAITTDKIAANTITAAKMGVSDLSSMSANLGFVTAGTLDATGYVRARGGVNIPGYGNAAIAGNDTYGQKYGGIFFGGSFGGAGVVGIAGNSNYGGQFYAGGGNTACFVQNLSVDPSGVGLTVSHLGGGTALAVSGNMTISTTNRVTNLNAHLINGFYSDGICTRFETNSGDITPTTGAGSGGKLRLVSSVSGYTIVATDNYTMSLQATSDERLKEDIWPEIFGKEFIQSLNPVSYRYKVNPKIRHHGFIANNMVEYTGDFNDSLSLYYENSNTYGTDYISYIGPIVKSLKETWEEIDELRKEITELKTLVQQLLNNQN